MTIIGLSEIRRAKLNFCRNSTPVVLCCSACEVGLIHRSWFEEIVQSIYLSTHILQGFLGNHLMELH
jgi:hypothetical protein